MPHVLDPLPFAFDALEPVLDARTLEIHHDKHHAAYVNNLNKALEAHGDLGRLPLVELISNLDSVPEAIRTTVRNNGGGHFAHNLYWRTMKKGGGGEPGGDLAKAIASAFGSFADFRAKLSQAAVGQFGSGWAWLYAKDGKLGVMGTPGHDGPEMSGGKSILVVDVWEHAYYLKYENRRADYVEAWWSLQDWARVAENHRAAIG
jgi:Fe-Mn family superoxide dismutase